MVLTAMQTSHLTGVMVSLDVLCSLFVSQLRYYMAAVLVFHYKMQMYSAATVSCGLEYK